MTDVLPDLLAHRRARRARLRGDVRAAARVLPTAWPIRTFIAVNPLAGLEGLPFGTALDTARAALGIRGTLPEADFRAAFAAGRVTAADLRAALHRRGLTAPGRPALTLGGGQVEEADLLLADLLYGRPTPAPARRELTATERRAPDVADAVDAHTAAWCAAFLAEEHAGWPLPGRDRGLYGAWRGHAPHDRTLPAAAREHLRRLPPTPDDAVLEVLDARGVPEDRWAATLRAHLTRLPGWAAHVRWRGDRDGGPDLVEYLAVRLACEEALLAAAGATGADDAEPLPAPPEEPSARARAQAAVRALGLAELPAPALEAAAAVLGPLPVSARTLVWLEAYEAHHRDALLAALRAPRPVAAHRRPAAQVVCCIDVRSEGLRRHLEATGPYETLGSAGFFGVAMAFRDLAGGPAADQCPVLVRPRFELAEEPAAGGGAARRLAGLRTLGGAREAFGTAKEDLLAPFALAEAAGWAAGPLAAARTLAAGPTAALGERLGRLVAPPARTAVDVPAGLAPEERAAVAEACLATMALPTGGRAGELAPLVVLCGHGGTSTNNPYASALDCGACGGHRGGPNARSAAALLNLPDVRAALAERGTAVPADTWFVAAEHDTATDRVRLLDVHLTPPGHRAALDRLAADLAEAGARLAAERCAALPGAPRRAGRRRRARHVRSRAADWAQVVPEWGLAGNAAFVVAPRSTTVGLDLGRRVFLHSYDAAADTSGVVLETILTAPLVVAQWINAQYYFSTVDPEVLGAGTKTVHNVVGDVGVLSGTGGDLRLGLPWQSVADGDRLVHEPMRLLAVVEAPLARTAGVLARNRELAQLFANEWLALAAREHPGDPWQRWTPSGWAPWSPTEEDR
ncbi:hypothetical protein SAMN04488107_0784 [Geodermatophilus saharensis]|uniref:Probable inorganic carbon transporter subunit DabA n=1 Tax=Geodermatophilus saharensis TaxID=1137994 RepID=A0A239AG22_9ACTN|nr:DUF2309 domain-containing protein [Geodermatophilus saharensis]SNR94636.1 hypothetical protein SAMN04488107_0784 [Geodermatophilus saharensis]